MSPKDRMKLFRVTERNSSPQPLSWSGFKKWIQEESNQWKLVTALPLYPMSEDESLAVKRLQEKLNEPTDWIRQEVGSKLLPKGFGQ